jgi:hypothetical protein
MPLEFFANHHRSVLQPLDHDHKSSFHGSSIGNPNIVFSQNFNRSIQQILLCIHLDVASLQKTSTGASFFSSRVPPTYPSMAPRPQGSQTSGTRSWALMSRTGTSPPMLAFFQQINAHTSLIRWCQHKCHKTIEAMIAFPAENANSRRTRSAITQRNNYKKLQIEDFNSSFIPF